MADKYYPPVKFEDDENIIIRRPILTPEQKEQRMKEIKQATVNMMRFVVFEENVEPKQC